MKTRVLLVDDDADQLAMRQMILERAGYAVAAASSAPAAIAQAEGCGAAVLDLIPESAAVLDALPSDAKVIVISGREPDEAVRARASAVLRKPSSSAALLAQLARVLAVMLACAAAAGAHTFQVTNTGEVVADLDMRAPGTNWAEPGHEAALATVLLDGKAQQNVMLYAGGDWFTYHVFAGRLETGEHRLEVQGAGVETRNIKVREDNSEVVRNAPVLYARADTIGRYTDVPLVVYCERLMRDGRPALRYTVIFSNEDGGTSTRALMARWGRTTDIEYVYEGELQNGIVRDAVIQGRDHKQVPFTGDHDGTHPLLMPVTDNNMVGAARPPSPIRYQITPYLVDLSEHSRDMVMDEHPFTYKVMSEELLREHKLRPYGVVDGENVSDPRNYLYVEMALAPLDSAVAAVVRLNRGEGSRNLLLSNVGRTDMAIDMAKRRAAESGRGYARTTIELPPGTTAQDIAEIGFACLTPEKTPTAACRVEAVPKVFLLGKDYVPGPNVWTLTHPVDIPAGQIWTALVRW